MELWFHAMYSNIATLAYLSTTDTADKKCHVCPALTLLPKWMKYQQARWALGNKQMTRKNSSEGTFFYHQLITGEFLLIRRSLFFFFISQRVNLDVACSASFVQSGCLVPQSWTTTADSCAVSSKAKGAAIFQIPFEHLQPPICALCKALAQWSCSK